MIQAARAIRASLDAILAADTIFRIDQYRAIHRLIGGTGRAYLNAGWFLALVAQLGHEERLFNLLAFELAILVAIVEFEPGLLTAGHHVFDIVDAVDKRMVITIG